jgi:hypothetical protein
MSFVPNPAKGPRHAITPPPAIFNFFGHFIAPRLTRAPQIAERPRRNDTRRGQSWSPDRSKTVVPSNRDSAKAAGSTGPLRAARSITLLETTTLILINGTVSVLLRRRSYDPNHLWSIAHVHHDVVKHATVMAMENLMDYVILAFLLMGLTAFFGMYAIGMVTLRVAVNGCVAVFGVSSFGIWARRQKSKTFPPKVGSSSHDDKKRQAS